MKHCIDCKHYLDPGYCARTTKEPSICSPYADWLVRGGPEPTSVRHYLCETERTGGFNGDCGVCARFFEPKITEPEPIAA